VKQRPKVELQGPSTIQRNTWTSYTARILNEDGNGVPYAQVTIAASDPNVSIRKGGKSSNPITDYADSEGIMTFEIRSLTAGGTTFTLYASCGTIYASMTVVQLP
jgi:hypothetical protein